jgi:hypothetical protein
MIRFDFDPLISDDQWLTPAHPGTGKAIGAGFSINGDSTFLR